MMSTKSKNSRDQWLIAGDCNKCRRKDYCKSACDKHKQHLSSLANIPVVGALYSLLWERKT